MQGIKKVSCRNTLPENRLAQKRKECKKLQINSTILSLLDRTGVASNGAEKEMLRSNFTSMFSTESLCRMSHLEYDSIYKFELDLRFFLSLKTLKISTTKKICLSSLNRMRLDTLIIKNVNCYDFLHTSDISVFKLVLDSLSVPLKVLEQLLVTCKPRAISLNNMTFPESHPANISLLMTNMLLKVSGLVSLRIKNTSMSAVDFYRIVKILSLKDFSYIQNNDIQRYCARGLAPASYQIQNMQPISTADEVSRVEVFIASFSMNLESLLSQLRMVRYVSAKHLSITTTNAACFKGIVRLTLKKCHFTKISFYDLVSVISNTIKEIRFVNTTIPLDGMVYMKSLLKNCRIIIENG